MNTNKIRINTSSGYDVYIGHSILDGCGKLISEVLPVCRTAVITDSNVAELYLERVCDSLKKEGYEIQSFIFPAGEESKNLAVLSDILEFLSSIPLTRTDCVIALGGGVTGDMSGFAAGCYLRGIKYIQIPTTFLAAVDSSVGGKTAVDLKGGKNLAGLFIQPQTVICDVDCLSTLSDETFADGAAEAIKTGILDGEPLFSMFERDNIKESLSEIISLCVKFKGKVVEEDEFEKDIRRTLNLGHTVAHAIEKCSNYTVTHGHAVAIGTAIIAKASSELGFCSKELSKRISDVMIKNKLPVTTPFSAKELYEASLSDKKRSADSITVVIPEGIGNCTLKAIPISELYNIIRAGLN